jgi:hypothetical protein
MGPGNRRDIGTETRKESRADIGVAALKAAALLSCAEKRDEMSEKGMWACGIARRGAMECAENFVTHASSLRNDGSNVADVD